MSNIKVNRDPFNECIFIDGVAYHRDFFKFMAEIRPWESESPVHFTLKTTEQGTPAVAAYNPNERLIRKREVTRLDDSILRRLAGMTLGEVAVDEAVPMPTPPNGLASRDDTAPQARMAEAQAVRWVNPEPLPEEAERPF